MGDNILDPALMVVEMRKETGLLVIVRQLMENINLLFLGRCISDLASKELSCSRHRGRKQEVGYFDKVTP